MSSDAHSNVQRRKLIEVSIPLQKINEESAREKSIRHGHPSTLHLWWARRPLAAARAVLFSQLVDDPASRPDLYPTEAEQIAERKRLFELIERLVVWENSNDEQLLAEAHRKIMESTDGNPPPILDPFAGGGTIPLEAQRLGLEAHASDLNPVAVLINKALIEIPPKFAGQPPVWPGAADETIQNWPRATGLAEDVRRYGQWMRDEAQKRIGHLYPKATLPDGTEATVIAWIWARTVTCPNPECRIAMPLVRSWWLGKKKGKEAYVVPAIEGKTVRYEIGHDPAQAPTKETDGTVGRTGATCIRCGTAVELKYIRSEGRAGRMGEQLMATVAEGKRRRVYLAPSEAHSVAAAVTRPDSAPAGELFDWPGRINVVRYGLTTFASLFTPRQLTALTTFSDLVGEARELALRDALAAGMTEGSRLDDGGTGAVAYADAVATYLGLSTSKATNLSSSITTWMSDRSALREVFARQAIPMSWDFAEANLLGSAGGGLTTVVDKVAQAVAFAPMGGGVATQTDAADSLGRCLLISTDPPYYDNIGYSDLSDYFYVWLRRSLRGVHPSILSTMLVPKTEELVANPYRHNGKEGAHKFFEEGFRDVFRRARENAYADYPITVYYAFKQQDSSEGGQSSTGWETLLEGMIRSGWQITATWPMRTEGSGRLLAKGTNALASSIVLALRPRPEDAPRVDRRAFLARLRNELPASLRELQQGAIAPVDLPQAAIGPGMAIFSEYNAVLEDDGSKMTVRTALQRINAILDEVLGELENDFDAPTRFALTWFRQNGFDSGKFGDAESLANARSISLDGMERSGILTKGGGRVALIAPTDMPADYDPSTDSSISQWEVVMHLVRVLDSEGIPAASTLLSLVPDAVDTDLCRELASLLFKLAEDRKSTALAVSFNGLGAAWSDIARGARGAAHQEMLL
ncbi:MULTISPECIES: DUF1156 domain-containing protein [Gordonia]|uniref:DUF1156 domain-containing protein n=1 Tax=Gordonia sihwensis NBRC 108236 TaxID=1223544 RepID=L7LLR3_9ACTN|nr:MULTISPECIES: DUF1156 domain-containing protein [Gordonia]AUH69147.1 DUF1156 domain-containing protein [Gordonia sp. YC-JH1]MBY4569654.1 hypothetical protein [Gordonia sihwensis]GAC60963.1 hypothetical protein GSI01S_13_01460 [Gordonia sihwensis NBRC 108236]